MQNRTAATSPSLFTDEEMPPYRCLTVSIGEATNYFRHYADHWLRAHRADGGGWAETVVAPESVEIVCGYYSYRTAPLSDYPL
jgi:hypothetical protein